MGVNSAHDPPGLDSFAALTESGGVVGEASVIAPGELQTGGHGGTQGLAVFVGVDGGRVHVAGQIVPVASFRGEFGVQSFAVDVGVEEDCFAVLFLLVFFFFFPFRENRGGDQDVRLCISFVRIPRDFGHPWE